VPEPYPHAASSEFFRNPEVLAAEDIELKWSGPDEEGLVAFLCGEKQFNEDRCGWLCGWWWRLAGCGSPGGWLGAEG
jgi:hypothetical protein